MEFRKDNMSEYCKNCYKLQEQLDQLKADREEALKQLEFIRTLNTVKEAETRKLSKTIAEIKEIAKKSYRTPLAEKDCIKCDEFLEQILQKISEC